MVHYPTVSKSSDPSTIILLSCRRDDVSQVWKVRLQWFWLFEASLTWATQCSTFNSYCRMLPSFGSPPRWRQPTPKHCNPYVLIVLISQGHNQRLRALAWNTGTSFIMIRSRPPSSDVRRKVEREQLVHLGSARVSPDQILRADTRRRPKTQHGTRCSVNLNVCCRDGVIGSLQSLLCIVIQGANIDAIYQ